MKKFLTLLAVSLMSVLMVFTFTACGGAGNGDNGGGGDEPTPPPAHTHEYTEETAWFDASHHFAKTLKCSCGETKTRSNIQISTAEELVNLSADINAGKEIGSAKIEIMNDINLTGDWTPIDIDDSGFGVIYNFLSGTGSKVTISGIRVPLNPAKANAGLFGKVSSSLSISNIALTNLNVVGNYAGGFIGKIDLGYANNKVEIKNCSVTGQITGAADAGSVYGYGNSTEDGCSVFIDGVAVQTNVIATKYAGGVAGSMTNAGKGFTATITNVDFTSTVVTSAQAKSAGQVVGYVGFGGGTIDDETTQDAPKGVVATANTVVINRVYGLTGWTSSSNMSVFKFGAAYTLTFADAEKDSSNQLA